jgi:hypothetical protein
MPLSDADKGQISAFLSSLIRGKASLGIGAMSMIKLYNAAQHEHVDIPELLVRDPEAVEALVGALQNRAKYLSAGTVKKLDKIVALANA